MEDLSFKDYDLEFLTNNSSVVVQSFWDTGPGYYSQSGYATYYLQKEEVKELRDWLDNWLEETND